MSPSSVPNGTSGSSLSNGNTVHYSEEASRVNHDHSTPASPPVPIAIVGMSCRFSGDVNSPEKLWELCAAGKDGWSPIPEARFDIKSLYHPDKEKQGRTHVVGGYFLNEDVALFDAAFFNFSGEVASSTDPQIRLLLEAVYEATEDAGMPIEKLAGSNTSVFTGCFNKDYHELQTKDPEVLPHSFMAGTGTAMHSNRISHFYDLQGPSMSIDTGCSAGLVALHQGCQSIRCGESNISVVGAASTLLSPDSFIAASSLGALGGDGRCYAWDSRAQGFGRGEGVAALILKPLNAALKDGDHVHAVIRESGVNQDGKTTTISSPSADAQIKLIKECYKRAGLDLSETGYVEAHMTGTPAGDPIEAAALASTFGQSRAAHDPIIVGSVKTNVGHTEPVSGLAAVIKAAFVLKNGLIPPNLNYEKTNPSIHLKEWHLQVPTALTPWPQAKALRASINNFGYGGTNAHIIMELAPKTHAKLNEASSSENGNQDSDKSFVYIFSAKDSAGAQAMASNFAAHFRHSITRGQAPSPSGLAYTMAERRSLLPWMVTVRARGLAELADRLEAPGCKALHASSRPLRLGFVFNGQGAQWHAMGRELIGTYPVFGMGIQEADKVLKEYGAAWSLYDELMRDEKTTRVSDVNISQPISVAVQLCVVDLLKSWGIIPSAVTSHSSGEMAAAYTVGALSFKQALGVAYFRGELALKNASSLAGGMLAAAISSETAERYIANIPSGIVVVACINSPNSTTLSGDLTAIDVVESLLKKDGIFARKLKVPMAYHSSHMSHMAQEYTERLRDILPGDGSWTGALFTSPVTGGIVTSPKVFTPEHWVRNLTSPVLFSQAFESMCFSPTASSIQGSNVDIIVEIGAHSTLAGPIRQILESRNVKMPYASCLKRSVNAVETMQDLVCDLLGRGHPVTLSSVNSPLGEKQKFVHDLPAYPWNHTASYWVEPRISKEMKNRRFPPHELLGSLLAGTNGLTPTWRNFIRLSDIEWLRDHQVDTKVVFPGAGYVAMAIEAVRLLVDPSEKTIHGYRLRDVDIVNALVIPESSVGVETQICLRRCSEKELDHKGWYEFELSSLGISGSWAENCRGYITAETGDAIKAAMTYEARRPCEDSYLPTGAAVTNINTEELFASLREMGIYHGPSFQNLIDSHAAGNRAKTNVAIGSVATETHDYVLHPTTLDSILQATYSSLPKDMGRDSMALPRSIRSLFVPRGLRRQGGEKLQVFSELVRSDKRGFTSNVIVTNRDSNDTEPFLEIHDFFGQTVPRQTDEPSPVVGLCSKSSWELDILHSVPTAVKNSMKIDLDEDEAELERKLVQVSYHFIHDTVNEFEGKDIENWPWHHKRFYEWMKSVIDLGKRGALGPGSQKWSQTSKGLKTMLADELNAGDVSGQLTVRVGQKLASIFRGDVTPLELMMEGNLLNQFYMNHQRFKTRSAKHLAKIAELYAVKYPGAKVLEIGGGTGGATGTVLDAFAARGDGSGSLLGHYTFTDISPGFFEAAKHKFATWSSMIEFKKLDIEADPIEQSFTAGSYDLIVASMVLHATKNLHKALSHVRKLLKPGGKLLMAETTRDRLDAQLIFGTLPGWWLAEEPDRQMSPNAPLETWDRVLRETGFTGVEFNIGDYSEEEFESASIILSSATATAATVTGPVAIVYAKTTTAAQPWLSQLAEEIQLQTGISPSIESLHEVQCQDKVCIFVAEMESPFVSGMDEEAFEKLRNLLLNCRGVLWLSCSGIIDCEQPSFAPTQGLLRSLRHGESSKGFIHLDFEQGPDGPWTSDKISHIVHVLQRSFDDSIEMSSIDWEYAVTDSMLHVPRFFPDKTHDAVASNSQVDPAPQVQPFNQPNRPFVWETPSSGIGGLDPYFVDKTDIVEDVPSGKVEIESKAFGLNFREVMVALGQLDEPLVGYECAGIITKLGPNTEQSGLRVGDRVCALCNGSRISSKGQVSWLGVAKIPDDMSWEQAASIPVAYVTAYSSLISIARLQKGESVLIHAATGGTGQAAVVLAQHIGAKVFATCSTAAKRDLLIEKYNIDPEHIFSSRDSSFGPAVMAKTNGRGVDVVLNSLSGPLLKATWDCIARFGRFVDIAKVDIEAARRLDTTPFRRSASYVSFDIIQLCEYNGQQTQETLLACLRICQERGAQPIWPIIPYSISDMEKALRQMQGGTHMGKLVLVPGDGDLVKVVTRPRPFSLCDPNATYLIVGGVTGICRAIAEWMMTEKGAQNLLIISRHATSHKYATQLRVTAKVTGCNLQIRDCDASDELSLVELLAESSRSMPPVRGVVNGAMVLDDTILERMTFEQWQRGLKPKIGSSANLHKHLPNVSFFIMLSSLTGVVGQVSQANYAAGNTYQDALARHRTRLGLSATVLDLGPVLGAGFVAEKIAAGDNKMRARLESAGFGAVDIKNLLRLVGAAISDSPRCVSLADSQVIVGLADFDAFPAGAIVRQDRRFSTLQLASQRGRSSVTVASTSDTNSSAALVQRLSSASTTTEEATTLLTEAITRKLADIFNISAAEIDSALPMSRYGVDSLVAVELRNWLNGVVKAKVSVFEVLQSASLAEFGALVVVRSDLISSKAST